MSNDRDERPTFSAEDLAEIDDAEAAAALDAEDVAVAGEMRKAGLDDETIARLRGVSPEELAAKSPPTLGTVASELRALEERMRTDRRAYFRDEPAQAEYRRLLEARDRLNAGRAPAADGGEDEAAAIDREIAGIEEVMRTDRRRYERTLEVRYRELLEAKEALKTGEGDPDGGLAPELVEEWRSSPEGFDHHIAVAHGVASDVLDSLDETAASELVVGFDALPANARTQVFRYMAVEPSGSALPASQARLDEFAAVGEEAAQLVEDWGRHAARRLGVVIQRTNLMLDGMADDTEREAAMAWFDQLPPAVAVKIVRRLAGRSTLAHGR
jgi:hypothetical protein